MNFKRNLKLCYLLARRFTFRHYPKPWSYFAFGTIFFMTSAAMNAIAQFNREAKLNEPIGR